VRATVTAAMVPWLVLAGGSVTAFVWILHTQLERLYGLTAPAWDLGQGQQVLWSLAFGHGWASSYEYGKDFFGIHIEPIFLPIAGLERIWPSPVVPLVVSAVGLAAMAPAAYLMFRAFMGEHPWARWLALGLAAPMPFWAATQEAASDQFHPENLAPALAMLTTWAGLTQRRWLFWGLAVATLCCKEDQTYTVFIIGLVVVRFGGERMQGHGRRVMVLAASWLVIGVALLAKLAAGAATPGLIYYWWMLKWGGQNYFLLAISRPDPWLVMAGLLAGLLALPLLAPRWLLLVVPPLAASLASDHDPMERLQAHYVLIVMFPLILAAGVGAKRLLERKDLPRRLPAPALVLGALPALVIGFAAGRLPPALGAEPWLYDQPSAAGRLLAAAAVIPADAAVYADDGAVVWLSNRVHVGLYNTSVPDSYIVIDRDAYAYRGTLTAGRTDAIAQMQQSGRPLLVDDGRFQVWGPLGR